MKLSSLLLGDLADLFQDSRLTDAESAATQAASTASHNRTQIARLAQAIEQRIREVEQENSLLSLLLLRVLQHLSKSQPDETQKIIDEVSAIVKSGVPASSEVLRQMLDLPKEHRTPITSYTKPVAVRPRPPQRPAPASKPKK
jgi:ferritin-like metal-binding protein YciE